MKDIRKKPEGRNTRRDAIKRMGLIGIGAVVAGRAGRVRADDESPYSSQAPYVSCAYSSCWDNYTSQNTYTSSEGVNIYGSISIYSSSCSCY